MRAARTERGAAALLVAAGLLFMLGAAALAVDTSSFYQDARADQTTADLACLAGVAELPDTSAAITAAAEIVTLNWPEKALGMPVVSGTTGVMSDGAGNTVTINANHNGNDDEMSVVVSEQAETDFAAVIGTNQVTITQEAFCFGLRATGGAGVLPLGALPGTFSGDLFDCASKVTGNCGAIGAPNPGANSWRDALENGMAADVSKHHGNWGSNDAHTGLPGIECVNVGQSCNAADTEPGNMVGPFNQGVANRMSDISNADCVQGGDFNCDSMTQVLGGNAASTLASLWSTSPPADFPGGFIQPAGWHNSLYGPYSAVKNQQYYYDGGGIKCDSPRLATVPIVVRNDNWALGDSGTTWPNGRKRMKIIGFYTVYIREPDNRSDVGNGSGNGLGQIVSDVIWFGPNATCEDGSTFAPFGSINVPAGVKLIAG